VDLRALTRARAAALLALSACGGPEPDAAGGAPPSVAYSQHVSAGDVSPPADSLVNPLRGDAGAAGQGEVLFATMNCDGCHGGGGLGFVGPSLVDGRWRYGGAEGALFHSIYYGRPRGMPAYGGFLSAATVWQLVTYLQSLPTIREAPTTAWP
jgi:cytochrome c oxidase cbb3-type subunit 3